MNPHRVSSPTAHPGTRFGPCGFRPKWPIAAAASVLFCALSVVAQGAGVPAQTNALKTSADLTPTNDIALTGEFTSTNETVFTNDFSAEEGIEQTNNPAPTNAPPQSAKTVPGDRATNRQSADKPLDQNRKRPASEERAAAEQKSPAPGSGRSDSRFARPAFSTFKIIADRNIFDPNRTARRRGGPAQPKPVAESLSLVGIMSYEKGTFAFFDGTSSSYKKALKSSDTIAGYKLTNIGPNSVTLLAGTNQVEMRVGSQLRREEEGPWLLASQSESYAASASSSSSTSARTDSAAGGDANEILKRLRQRKEQE